MKQPPLSRWCHSDATVNTWSSDVELSWLVLSSHDCATLAQTVCEATIEYNDYSKELLRSVDFVWTLHLF